MFSSPILGNSSIGSPVQYWEKAVYVYQSSTGKRFYGLPSPLRGKLLGSPVRHWEIILASPVHAVLGKGSISSQVQYWEKVL